MQKQNKARRWPTRVLWALFCAVLITGACGFRIVREDPETGELETVDIGRWMRACNGPTEPEPAEQGPIPGEPDDDIPPKPPEDPPPGG